MTTSNFNIRLDNDLKTRAFAVIERFGLTPTQAMRMFLTQIAETDSVPLSLDYARQSSTHTLSRNGEAMLRASIRDMENGAASDFDSVEALTTALTHAQN
ncbi:type II toxin-antitoxin system RelB/DinJ family antitoxin [uncultured Cardiobacterium sp.]|uniref:type II toxin-antitoxin system RelB/DinJ family antitoxin n=1 Tax=uncultured Cardiobacterium sp. TaxID=417619 RepID=UPI00261DFE34|nr:type II toxin-antitoxin system RelB/DinJ family antitoxin [uncultured Cardiobacterium sp.]